MSPTHLYVAGDSHAGAYTRMLRRLAQAKAMPVSIFASPGCGFINLLTPVAELEGGCPAQNKAMREALAARVRPGDVVFLPALRLRRYRDQEGGALGNGATAVSEAAVAEARTFIEAIVARGARVILEAPKPAFKSPPFRCADWFDRMNPICAAGFSEDRAAFERRRASVLAAERALGALPGVTIWDPAALLCSPTVCDAWRDGRPLNFDADHLSGFADDLLLPSFSDQLD